MSTIDIIRDIVQSLSFDIPVESIVDNGDGTYDINVCNTYHQSANNCTIQLDSKNYSVTGVETDKKIVIKEVDPGSGAPSITVYPLAAPKFFHGTLFDTNNELIKITKTSEKLPMVYLFEKFQENKDRDRASIIDRTAVLRLFCMDNAKYGQWNTGDHYNNVIDSMANLVKELDEAFIDSSEIGKYDAFTTVNWVNLGVDTSNGQPERTIEDFLSGVEMRISLPILIETDCINC